MITEAANNDAILFVSNGTFGVITLCKDRNCRTAALNYSNLTLTGIYSIFYHIICVTVKLYYFIVIDLFIEAVSFNQRHGRGPPNRLNRQSS